jgi:hypothetical protein
VCGTVADALADALASTEARGPDVDASAEQDVIERVTPTREHFLYDLNRT